MIKERSLTQLELTTLATFINVNGCALSKLGFAIVEGESHATYKSMILMPNGVEIIKQGKTEQQFNDYVLAKVAEFIAPNIERMVLCGDTFIVGDELRTVDGLLSKQEVQPFRALIVLSDNTFMNSDTLAQLSSPHITRVPLMPSNLILIVNDGAVSIGLTSATLCEYQDEPGKYSLHIGLHLSIDRSKVHVYSC